MAYEVTATKKRPQLFDELAGQEFVVSTLKNALSKDRIAHAYLFSGPRGVGKTSAARILARTVNCQERVEAAPCGSCSSCQEIAKGRSLDVIEIDGASNTSVNDIRKIRDEVLFAPNSSPYKIFIIDEVHMLSNSAFNALLKTIEEPPPYIIFIFATTEIHKVPATIRSRCQQFSFRLISVEVIKGLLESACSDEGINAEAEALFWIAKEATGSMRDAFTLFDQVSSFSDGDITLEKIRDKLGLVGMDRLNSLVERVVSGSAVMDEVEIILSQGVAVEQFIGELGEYFRNLLLLRHGVRSESLLGCNPESFSQTVREAFTVDQLELAIEMILKLFRDLRFSLNQRYELELLLSRITGLTNYLSPAHMLKEIKRLKALFVEGSPAGEGFANPQGQEAPSGSKFPARFPAEDRGLEVGQGGNPRGKFSPQSSWNSGDSAGNPPSSAAEIDTLKADVLGKLKREKLALSSALEKALRWRLEGQKLILTFNNDFPARLVRQDQTIVAAKAEEMMGWSPVICVEMEEDREEDVSPLADERDLADEQILAVKKVFRGEVIQGGSDESL